MSNSSVHRASAILTSSYVAPATAYDIPPNTRAISLVYSYTLSTAEGADLTGYARIQPTWTVAGQEARDVLTDTEVVTADEIVAPIKQLACDTPNATCTDVLVFEVPPGAEAVSFAVKEVGDAVSPGTFASWIARH